MKLKIVDTKKQLIDSVKSVAPAVWTDYFIEAEKTPNAVLMTASNPAWTFGGGIDAKFKQEYPDLVREKQLRGGSMERIGNICFCITVDETLQATPEMVKKAIEFALSQTREDEVLLVSGVGTGIGGMSIDEFVQIIREVV